MTTDRPQRFARQQEEAAAAELAAQRDELHARLQAEQAAYDDLEAELIRASGRVRALEQELRLAWARVDLLEQELAYERLPARRRVVRRRPKPPQGD